MGGTAGWSSTRQDGEAVEITKERMALQSPARPIAGIISGYPESTGGEYGALRTTLRDGHTQEGSFRQLTKRVALAQLDRATAF